MSLNKNALIRYKTIDKSLQNKYREWTLDDLIEACSEALYEYEGREVSVSKRTVQLDIQMMRSDKLGYNAPIEVYNKKYYKYQEDGYSITNIPITENDMNVLSETVGMLKQFKDFSLFSELGGIIQRLEDKVHSEKTNQASIIHLDKNENLKGLEHLDLLYQSILKKICLNIQYRSFKAKTSSEMKFQPYILKEFNNRWFLVGKGKKRQILTLALDRIESIQWDLTAAYIEDDFDGDAYYKNTIGVTVMNDKQLLDVILWVDQSNAPYVLTKPLHSSQKVIKKLEDGSIEIQISVHHNYELERLLLGFGNSLEVLGPETVRTRMKRKLQRACALYEKTSE